MGDHSAGRGSEVCLKGSEIETFEILNNHSYLASISYYNRFRNDISTHLTNTNINILMDIIWIISKNYPANIQLNLETNIIQGKFLNIRHYTLQNTTEPTQPFYANETQNTRLYLPHPTLTVQISENGTVNSRQSSTF